MRDITISKAEFVALWVETLLYGIYVILFNRALRIMVIRTRNSRHKRNWPLIMASVAIFLGGTGHVLVVFLRALEAFIDRAGFPGGPMAYYGDLRNPLEVCQASFQTVVSFLGDSMAVYRVWVVYNEIIYAIILPMISLVATLVASIGSVVVIAGSSTDSSPIFIPKIQQWLPVFFGLTFSTSIICTSLIAIRLWYINYQIQPYTLDKKLTTKIITAQKIFIESATLYSSLMLVYLITDLVQTNTSIIFGDMVCPTIGIAFSLITIRVNDTFGNTEQTTTRQTEFSRTDHSRSNAHRSSERDQREHEYTLPLGWHVRERNDGTRSGGSLELPGRHATIPNRGMSKPYEIMTPPHFHTSYPS